MSEHYEIIGHLSLVSIPEEPQTILKVWEGKSNDVDAAWLHGVLEISRLVPALRIRTAHLASDRRKGPHVDGVPGKNLIWVHQGSGFFIENKPVAARPGDVIVFERSLIHSVEAAPPERYVRTVLTTIHPADRQKFSRFLQNGTFFDGFEPMALPL